LIGGGINVTVTVKNQGAVDSGPFNTMLATTCDGNFPQGSVGNLAPGASFSFSEEFVDGDPPCQLTATVDSGGQVTESNEANNSMTVLVEAEILQ
jgi:subtilase family serine protease